MWFGNHLNIFVFIHHNHQGTPFLLGDNREMKIKDKNLKLPIDYFFLTPHFFHLSDNITIFVIRPCEEPQDQNGGITPYIDFSLFPFLESKVGVCIGIFEVYL